MSETRPVTGKAGKAAPAVAQGGCVCGKVRLEIDVPPVWAWHDHARASQHAQGAAYTTYVGSWRSRFRITKGERNITRFIDPESRHARSFCKSCGTPLTYERPHAPKMVNIPRALFESRTGREPRYHLHIDEAPDWAYSGERLGPLKGYPGVLWERPKAKKRARADFDF